MAVLPFDLGQHVWFQVNETSNELISKLVDNMFSLQKQASKKSLMSFIIFLKDSVHII